MKQLLEFIPLILFFIVYKTMGVREAAIAIALATIIQLILLKLIYKKVEKQAIIMGIFVIIFGGLTAYFNQLSFLKWKVSIVYAIFALALLISQWVFKHNLIKTMLGKEITAPDLVWNRINYIWALFFILCLILNIIISRYFSDDIWVDFKSFGIIALTIIPSVLTGINLYPYLKSEEQTHNGK